MKLKNNLFLLNVEYIRKKKNEKIGDLEKAIEVSAGYFARLSKNSETLPGVEVLAKISTHYNVSIDTLLLQYIPESYETNDMIAKYVHKIYLWTNEGRLLWQRTDQVLSVEKIQYDSMFPHKQKVYTNGYIYECDLNDGSKIKVMPIWGEEFKKNPYGEYELTIMDGQSREWMPVCASHLTNNTLKMELSRLYNLIYLKEGQFFINSSVKKHISDFLKQEEQ